MTTRSSGNGLAPPHRIDLTAMALADVGACLLTRDEARARRALEEEWRGPAFLSVRSGLCALLEAKASEWPRGSEILVSALTITDIPKLIAAHGYVPIAVDVDPDTLQPRQHELVKLTTERTKAIVVAHLFGARTELRAIARFARSKQLMLIEDCAQAYVGPGWRGAAESDVAMFSFGTLKTGTALGGALFTIKDDELRARMAAVESSWPRQGSSAFALKAVATGHHVHIYPEGTVSPRLATGRRGAVQLAHALGLPIVPVGMSGCPDAFVGATPVPKRGHIRVRIGAPLAVHLPPTHEAFRRSDERTHRAALDHATARLMDALDGLLDAPYRRHAEEPSARTRTRALY